MDIAIQLPTKVMWSQARDSTYGNLHKTSAREKSSSKCLFANRPSFSKLFDDISLLLSMGSLCMVVDSLISAAKLFDFRMVLTGM